MQKIQLKGRTIKISLALDAEERFHRKRMGFIKFVLNQKKGIALHRIRLSHEKKSVVIIGQILTKTEENGEPKYNKYHDIDEEVQRS